MTMNNPPTAQDWANLARLEKRVADIAVAIDNVEHNPPLLRALNKAIANNAMRTYNLITLGDKDNG